MRDFSEDIFKSTLDAKRRSTKIRKTITVTLEAYEQLGQLAEENEVSRSLVVESLAEIATGGKVETVEPPKPTRRKAVARRRG